MAKIIKAKKISSPKEEKTEVKKAVSRVSLPYFNDDFIEGASVNAKRTVTLLYFLNSSFKKVTEVSAKEILEKNPVLKEKGEFGLAPNFSGKVVRYLRGLKTPVNLRILELEPKSFINSKGGTRNLITKYRVEPILK
jgi:hypothetical protein